MANGRKNKELIIKITLFLLFIYLRVVLHKYHVFCKVLSVLGEFVQNQETEVVYGAPSGAK